MKLLKYWGAVFLLSTIAAFYLDAETIHLRITNALQDLRVIEAVLHNYAKHAKGYPSTEEGLVVLLEHPAGLKHLPRDPWNNPYVYRLQSDGLSFQLYSAGLDGVDNGGGADDVVAHKKEYRCDDYGVNCPPTAKEVSQYVLLTLMALSFLVGVSTGLRWAYDLIVKRRESAD